jgi:uncharacterized protein (TIGR02246 family)
MKKNIGAAIATLLIVCSLALSQHTVTRAADEAAIRTIIAGLADAWTRGDGEAFGKSFAADADFTVWHGLYVKGRDAIAHGHAQIFSTIYKGTKLQINVRSIRFLRDDIAIVHTEASVVKKEEAFPSTPVAVPVLVLSKEKGRWQIAVFQNTKRDPNQAANQ